MAKRLSGFVVLALWLSASGASAQVVGQGSEKARLVSGDPGMSSMTVVGLPEARVLRNHAEPGATRRMHAHADATFHVLTLITGTLKVTLEGQAPIDVAPGDVIMIKAGAMHSFNNPGTVAATMVEVLGKAAPPKPAANAPLAKTWTVPRTPDGQPDLQGVWDYRTATPLERPRELGPREFLTDQEVAAFERRAAAREDGRPPEDARSDPSVHPPWWLDYGKQVVGTRRSSLIIDPPDGRVPPVTGEAQKRAADRRTSRIGRGPADAPEDRSLWERCITRGLPEGMLPAGYNNNVQFVQTPGYVLIASEMIHDARIVPLDGRAHLPRDVRQWTGDSRGRWEGDTLVVETVNFSDKAAFRGSGANLRLVERFTRVDAGTIEYRFTVDDPTTWERPWTVTFPLVKSDGAIYEYACHEGNYGLRNILSNARAVERSDP